MYNGKIAGYLKQVEEAKVRAERTNVGVLAKQKQLAAFHRQKQSPCDRCQPGPIETKAMDWLSLEEIEVDLPTAHIRPPQVEPRQGPAVRCMDLSIGYEGKAVASGIELEVEHQQRAAIVGDNGQGKTTLLRTPGRFAETRRGKSENGATVAKSAFMHSTSTRLCLLSKPCWSIWNTKPNQARQRRNASRASGSLLFRGGHTKSRSRCCPEVSVHACVWLACCWELTTF